MLKSAMLGGNHIIFCLPSSHIVIVLNYLCHGPVYFPIDEPSLLFIVQGKWFLREGTLIMIYERVFISVGNRRSVSIRMYSHKLC